MQLEELPECYRIDKPFDIKEVEDLVEGCGQHHRNIVSYNGLRQWYVSQLKIKYIFTFLSYLYSQALEEGEDKELSECAKDKE